MHRPLIVVAVSVLVAACGGSGELDPKKMKVLVDVSAKPGEAYPIRMTPYQDVIFVGGGVLDVRDPLKPGAPGGTDFNGFTGDQNESGNDLPVGHTVYKDHMVFAHGKHLYVWDVADPHKPAFKSRTELALTAVRATGMAVTNDKAVVATKDAQEATTMYILDLADLGAPSSLGSLKLKSKPFGVYAGPAGFVYVLQDKELQSLDVSGESAKPGASIATPAGTQYERVSEAKMDPDGKTLWVAGIGLYAVDVSEPANPKLSDRIESVFVTNGFWQDGKYLWSVRADANPTLQVWDVSDRANPVEYTSFPIPNARGIARSGNHFFSWVTGGYIVIGPE